jgi:hypothetical protein
LGIDDFPVLRNDDVSPRYEAQRGLANGLHQRAPVIGRKEAGGVGGTDGFSHATPVEQLEDGLFERLCFGTGHAALPLRKLSLY